MSNQGRPKSLFKGYTIENNPREKPIAATQSFFFYMGILLTSIVLLGFIPPVLSKPDGALSLPLLYHIHGVVFVSWFGLFTLQAYLVRGRRLALHRQLGQGSIVIAIAMLVTGYFMMRAAYALPEFAIGENSHVASMMFPFTDLVNFSIVFVLGFLNRSNGPGHKRLMLLAGLLILDPAVARLIQTIGAPFPLIPVVELGLFALLIGYDLLTLKKPHWCSLLGLALFFAAMAAKLVVAQTPAWADIARIAFG
jgi:hypothetical protein